MDKSRAEGGLRAAGKFHHKSEPGKPLISIITAVRNGEKHLERTIQSVLSQTYENIEYIVIDGCSHDRTLDIIRKYDDRIAYWLSEPDSGMYDAMNKGSGLASGDYALFLNSDDYLYNADSLADTLREGLAGGGLPLLIVGRMALAVQDTLFPDWISSNREQQIKQGNPPHPGTLISSAIYKKIPYNISFRLAGDYDFWETLRQKNLFQVKYVESVISVFRMGGISNCGKHEYLVTLELEVSKYLHHREFSVPLLIKSYIRANLKKIVMSILGENRYYRYIPYAKYRFRKRFLRSE